MNNGDISHSNTKLGAPLLQPRQIADGRRYGARQEVVQVPGAAPRVRAKIQIPAHQSEQPARHTCTVRCNTADTRLQGGDNTAEGEGFHKHPDSSAGEDTTVEMPLTTTWKEGTALSTPLTTTSAVRQRCH